MTPVCKSLRVVLEKKLNASHVLVSLQYAGIACLADITCFSRLTALRHYLAKIIKLDCRKHLSGGEKLYCFNGSVMKMLCAAVCDHCVPLGRC